MFVLFVATLLLVIAVMVWYNSRSKEGDVEEFRMIKGRHCVSSGKFCFEANSTNCNNINRHCTHYNTKNNPPWVKNKSAKSGRRKTAITKCKYKMRKNCSPQLTGTSDCIAKNKTIHGYYANPIDKEICKTNRKRHCSQPGNSSRFAYGNCIEDMDKCCYELHNIKPPCDRRAEAGFEPCS